MSQPTRQEIIEAYRELYMLLGFYQDRNPERAPRTRAIIEHVLPPLPRPTMAEVEWDDDKHYLAEAESARFGKVVMLGESSPSTQIDILVNNDQGIGLQLVHPADLTPTGKRYTLTEVETHAS